MLTLRPAKPADAPALAALAARLFRETFTEAFAAADLEAFLASSFGVEQQQREIADPKIATQLALVGEELAGYFQLHDTEPPVVVGSGRGQALRLWRLYLDRRFHGSSHAAELLAVARRLALSRGATKLWLSVWEGNQRARRFYEKAGFVDVGESSFALGASTNRDHLLVLELGPATTHLRRATPEDATALASFAARTFSETFAADNNPEDLALYLATTYTEEKQRREILDPEWSTLLLEVEGALAGYAQLRTGYLPAVVTTASPVEIYRFYIDRPWHGRGMAQRLMAACFDEAWRRGGQSVWLGVWEKNPRGITFYGKCGFLDVGTHTFRVGNDLQTDRVMVRRLEPSE